MFSTSAGHSPTEPHSSRSHVILNEAESSWLKKRKMRLAGTMDIVFVTPDYYTGVPRACMDGWGRRYIVVSSGRTRPPCHAAHTIPGLPMVSATSIR